MTSPSPTARRTPRRAALALIAALALLAAACGGDDASAGSETRNDGVASISDSRTDDIDDGEPADADLEAPANPEDAFDLFNECMIDAGFDFGGAIAQTGSGSSVVEIAPVEGRGIDEVDPQQSGSIDDFDFDEFQVANETCEGHLANIDQFFDMSPEERAALEDAELAWRTCMEDLGVEVPDLTGGGGIVIDGGAQGDVDLNPQTGHLDIDDIEFEKFEEAAEECQHHFDAVTDDLSAG